jgi:hypothetical protein
MDNNKIRETLLQRLRTHVRLPNSNIGMIIEIGLESNREEEMLRWLKDQNEDNKRAMVVATSLEVSRLLEEYEPSIESKFV